MDNKISVKAAANIVIGAAVVALPEALRAKLVEGERISIGEEAAVGEFIQIVRPSVVRMGGKPLCEVTSEADGQTVVVRYRSILLLRNSPVVRHRSRRWERTRRPDLIPIEGVVKTVVIQKANAVISNVVHNQYGGVGQLLLELQVPLHSARRVTWWRVCIPQAKGFGGGWSLRRGTRPHSHHVEFAPLDEKLLTP